MSFSLFLRILDSSLEGAAEIDNNVEVVSRESSDAVDRPMPDVWQCDPGFRLKLLPELSLLTEMRNWETIEAAVNRPLEIRESGYTTAKRPSTRELHSPLSSALLSLRFITIPTSLLFLPLRLSLSLSSPSSL